MATGESKKISVQEIVAERIIGLLDKGIIPWKKTWKAGAGYGPTNLISKKAYQGINVMMLLGAQMAAGYKSSYWLTYKQAQEKGGKVKTGEKASIVVYWNFFKKEVENPSTGKREIKTIPFLRYFSVFNIDQCEGIEIPEKKEEEVKENSVLENCEAIMRGFKDAPEISINGHQPAYTPSMDKVHMPEMNTFDSSEAYYATMFHELTHSTGHSKRLDRGLSTNFGSDPYAKEELIAEFGASFLSAEAGIDLDNAKVLENSVAYIQSWKKRISADPKIVVSAAGKAQKAADWILGKKETEVEGE
jgi:antirestriction protein ArdC